MLQRAAHSAGQVLKDPPKDELGDSPSLDLAAKIPGSGGCSAREPDAAEAAGSAAPARRPAAAGRKAPGAFSSSASVRVPTPGVEQRGKQLKVPAP